MKLETQAEMPPVPKEAREHLFDLIKDFSTAMLVTRGPGGSINARPMAVAQLTPDAEAYFATSLDSPKVWEIEADPRVTVTFQGDDRFAVLEGNAVIVADKRQIADLWSEDWRRWFPRGKDDPTLCLLRVAPQSGEYWDRSGLNGLTFLFDGLKAILQGTRAETDEPARHAKVQRPGKH